VTYIEPIRIDGSARSIGVKKSQAVLLRVAANRFDRRILRVLLIAAPRPERSGRGGSGAPSNDQGEKVVLQTVPFKVNA
jgi:hypothetical protein